MTTSEIIGYYLKQTPNFTQIPGKKWFDRFVTRHWFDLKFVTRMYLSHIF